MRLSSVREPGNVPRAVMATTVRHFGHRPHERVWSHRLSRYSTHYQNAVRSAVIAGNQDFSLAVRTPCVLPTLPDKIRQAARIRRILAPSRESSALSNDSEATASPRAVRAGGEAVNSPQTGRRSRPAARGQTSSTPRASSPFSSRRPHVRTVPTCRPQGIYRVNENRRPWSRQSKSPC